MYDDEPQFYLQNDNNNFALLVTFARQIFAVLVLAANNWGNPRIGASGLLQPKYIWCNLPEGMISNMQATAYT